MGRYLLSVLTTRDYPVVLGTNLFFTLIGLVTIVIVDISYAWADPRIRYQ
jgi:peptide/nickel transport system permease protein